MSVGVADVSEHILTQCSLADWLQTLLERIENFLVVKIAELLTETFEVAETVFVNKTHQAIKLKQGVLKWRSGEQNLGSLTEGLFQRVSNHTRLFVNVSQPVGLVNNHQVPHRRADIRLLTTRELVRTDDDDIFTIERPMISVFDGCVVRLGFKDVAGQKELFLQLLMPLLTQIGRSDDQYPLLPFRPLLGNDQTCLDGLPQSYLVGKNCAL